MNQSQISRLSKLDSPLTLIDLHVLAIFFLTIFSVAMQSWTMTTKHDHLQVVDNFQLSRKYFNQLIWNW